MRDPKIIDNDHDEITATLDGVEIRGWSYSSELERRQKMLMAREFAEGWYEAEKRLTPNEVDQQREQEAADRLARGLAPIFK